MNSLAKPTNTKLAELLAKARAQKEAASKSLAASSNPVPGKQLSDSQMAMLNKLRGISAPITPVPDAVAEILDAPSDVITDKYGNIIVYNALQQAFVDLAAKGNDCILLGAAGTGKTTCQKGVIHRLLVEGSVPILPANLVHKSLRGGTPGIVITSFTRRSVANIKRNISSDLSGNCITIHKLLEYQPEYFEVFDEKSGRLQ